MRGRPSGLLNSQLPRLSASPWPTAIKFERGWHWPPTLHCLLPIRLWGWCRLIDPALVQDIVEDIAQRLGLSGR